MIGLGMDLCEIARIERTLQKGDAFLQRFFTLEERAYIANRGAVGAQSAAAIFAAKEAFLKAAGVGLGGGIPLSDIGVVHEEGGAPRYALAGAAAQKLLELGATRAFLTLSHEAG
ncbi:MAG: 4'-phosphopantetheinyl transferase superfamily protein, partial [Clostridia bacterium]